MFKELFDKQAELNQRTGFDAKALRANFDPNLAGVWLNNYIAAMSNELLPGEICRRNDLFVSSAGNSLAEPVTIMPKEYPLGAR